MCGQIEFDAWFVLKELLLRSDTDLQCSLDHSAFGTPIRDSEVAFCFSSTHRCEESLYGWRLTGHLTTLSRSISNPAFDELRRCGCYWRRVLSGEWAGFGKWELTLSCPTQYELALFQMQVIFLMLATLLAPDNSCGSLKMVLCNLA